MNSQFTIIRIWKNAYAAPFGGGSGVLGACDSGGFRHI